MRYRHKKRGSVYEIIYDAATMQNSTDRSHDGELVVVYQNVDSLEVYVRPYREFHDGRFEEL